MTRETGWLGGMAAFWPRLTTVPCCSHIHGSACRPRHDRGRWWAVAEALRWPQPARANASRSQIPPTMMTAAKTVIYAYAPSASLVEPVLGERLRLGPGDLGHHARGRPSVLVL